MNNQQNYIDQQRNKYGETFYPQEGLQPVKMENDRLTKIAERLQRATLNDNLENRMRETVQKYKDSVKHAKKTGLMDKDLQIPIYAFNELGGMEKEII